MLIIFPIFVLVIVVFVMLQRTFAKTVPSSTASSIKTTSTASWIFCVGLTLFLIAFIIPVPMHDSLHSWEWFQGAFIFFLGTYLPLGITNPHQYGGTIWYFCDLISWLSNFSIIWFFPSALRWRWIVLIAPWLVLFPGDFTNHPYTFLPFYLWAIGIGLIHLSFYLRPQNPSPSANRELR